MRPKSPHPIPLTEIIGSCVPGLDLVKWSSADDNLMNGIAIKHIVIRLPQLGALATALLVIWLGDMRPAHAGSAAGVEAALGTARTQSRQPDFLSPDEAFRFDALADGPDRIRLIWEITDGYYLYRARIKASSTSDRAQLGDLTLPTGETKIDDYFGKQEVYHHQLVGTLPVARAGGAPMEVPIKVTYQGCATAGLCYPPITKTMNVVLPAASGPASGAAAMNSSVVAGIPPSAAAASGAGYVSEQDRFARLIQNGNLFVMLGGFFLAGLVLAFTPCVLPMVPILSGIIAGQGENVTTRRAFALSLTYVLGMAFTYTIAGALFAAAGKQVQTIFQQPWILALFAALFIALALSMFGAFTLQMPAAIQSRIADVSNRQSAGTFGGVAIMGVLSALIVTTCVGPALVGALVVISQTGQIARGSAALFAMSMGMGTPLLIVGASAGKLLPKAGPWMETVKKLFGVMMLAVAAWMLARIVPDRAALILWAIPAFIGSWLLWTTVRTRSAGAWLVRFGGVAAGLYGIALLAGAALGGTDPFAPIPRFSSAQHEIPFRTIKSVADLEHEVAAAKSQGHSVLLDFYADWCVSCKEMERYTFSDNSVQSALNGTVLLRANVTDNDPLDQALLQHFGIFGPPTIAFYGADGQERRNYRVVGYMKAADFATLARRALGANLSAANAAVTATP
jgi:thiol:disulfide interchange protein DsbD